MSSVEVTGATSAIYDAASCRQTRFLDKCLEKIEKLKYSMSYGKYGGIFFIGRL